ncbi:hypothetical protein MNBD_NITROSPIRAE03-1311, partial [hydrothermal vent metagenome]
MRRFNLMLMLYNLFYTFSLTLLLPVHLMKRPSHLRGRWLKERFGFVPLSLTHK